MDSTSIKPVVTANEPSRLPAGSTLQLANGIHVPHPHAEVNLAGQGDPRLGDTKAVTEYVEYKTDTVDDGNGKTKEVTVGSLQQKPLADEVKPKVITANPNVPAVSVPAAPAAGTGAAATADLHVAIEQPTPEKTA